MKEDMRAILIASLLHDIGKFSQRVSNEARWRHETFTQSFLRAFSEKLGDQAGRIIDLAATHHGIVSDRGSLIIKIADALSSAERYTEMRGRISPDRAALVSICSRIKLTDRPKKEAFLPLRKLSLRREEIFPSRDDSVGEDEYRRLWDQFADELRGVEGELSYGTWLSLLRVFTRSIPSATPWEREATARTVPDIPLYGHAKTTGAIAAAMAAFSDEELTDERLRRISDILTRFREPNFIELIKKEKVTSQPLFLMVRGDVGGIQSWLYRITRPEAESYRRIARRLRGRSFYIQLLTMAAAEWIRRSAGMPPANLIFCGGGTFDLLLPMTERMRDLLAQWRREIARWTHENFLGELSLELAWIELSPADFYDFGSVYSRLSEEMDRRKLRRSSPLLSDPLFWRTSPVRFVCPYCQTTPVGSPAEQCPVCRCQEILGTALPRAEYMILAFSEAKDALRGIESKVEFDLFQTTVAIANTSQCREAIERWEGGELTILKRDDTDGFLEPMRWREKGEEMTCGIWLNPSILPIARHRWLAPGRVIGEEVHKGETLDFGEIAALGDGAEMIGVLKMDVDRLGSILSSGISPASISRSAALSDAIELFFSGWLPRICLRYAEEWRNQLPQDDERRDLVENPFYVLYSGGDDLMIIGPWDGVFHLAERIERDFTLYCGGNPDITISGGIVVVKPHTPIQISSNLASSALERSKSEGRNRITAFNETLRWGCYREAIRFGEELTQAILSGEVPRTFPHFLLRLDRHEVNWVPKLYYVASRRIKPETIERLDLFNRVTQLNLKGGVITATSYAILKTRSS
ncbi:TPA: type III-A CRISPR-associated protein Cas10/Csm1 [Candidatus Poribacteria bacterium]|nr:type III-A CRISPR-associated protein Cas10/Csm1 [Candidatus Poribacteria bacterium]